MLAIANGSVNPIEQSLVLPKDATVCKHHIESHFKNATTKTPMQRIKDMEKQLIKLGVHPDELKDNDELDENDIKKKSTLKPTNQDKLEAMIIEAQQLRKDIEALS